MDVRLLGPIECWVQGRRCALGGPAVQAVLAVLALGAGTTVTTDSIVEDVYGWDLPKDPSAAVQISISRLRQALGAERKRLRHVGHGYVLDISADELDVARAEKAMREGQTALDSGRYETAEGLLVAGLSEWRHRTPLLEVTDRPLSVGALPRLQTLWIQLVRAANEAALLSDRSDSVIDRTRLALEIEPWDERLAAHLMEALHRAGRNTEALMVYANVASALRHDLHTEPGARLLELQRRIAGPLPDVGRLPPHDLLPQWFRAAIEELERTDDDPSTRGRLQLALAQSELLAGMPGWKDALERAGRSARAAGDTALLARCLIAGNPGWLVSPSPDPRRRREIEMLLRSADLSVGDRSRLLAAYATELSFTAPLATRVQAATQAVGLARSTGNPELLLSVLVGRYNAVWAPDTLPRRVAEMDEASRLAEHSNSRTARITAAGFAMAAAAEGGDLDGIDKHLATFRDLARQLGIPLYQWGALLHSSWRAALAGDMEAARALSDQARSLGNSTERPEADVVWASQQFAMAWMEGRLPGLDEGVLHLLPPLPLREAFVLSLDICRGEAEKAAHALRTGITSGELQATPRDQMFLSVLVLHAEAAVRLADRTAGEVLFGLLSPFRDQLVFNGCSVFGPVARFLADLADLLGRPDAATHRRAAVEMCRRLRAPVLLGQSQGGSKIGLPGGDGAV